MMFGPKDDYLIKSIRADEMDFFREFVLQCTRTKVQQQKFPLRIGHKRFYTVDGTGVLRRPEKHPQYTPEEKLFFSKATSTSLVVPTAAVPIFGHDRGRSEKLVGMMFSSSNILFTKRFFIYDGGTIDRPYDHDTEIDAVQYFEEKVKGEHPILFHEVESFKKALQDTKNKGKLNEVLARVRWTNDGNTRLFIAANNLESRLLAQDRARILHHRLLVQSQEMGHDWDELYKVPICFYAPGDVLHLTPYDDEAQERDRQEANEIFMDQSRRQAEEDKGNYEFLLAIDKLRDKYTDDEWMALVDKLIKNDQPAIVWSLLEKIPRLYEDPCSEKLILFALTRAAIAHGSTEVMVILLKKPTIINSVEVYRDVMRSITPEERIVVYEVMKDKLPHMISSASELGIVLSFLTSEQCIMICDAIKRRGLDFVTLFDYLSIVLVKLNQEQMIVVNDALEDIWTARIKFLNDRMEELCTILRDLSTKIICDGMKDKWNDAIKSIDDLGCLLSQLTPEQVKAINDRWIGFVTSTEDFRRLMDWLSPPLKKTLCDTLKDKWPDIFKSVEDFHNILVFLPPDQKTEVSNLISFITMNNNSIFLASALMGSDNRKIKVQLNNLFHQRIRQGLDLDRSLEQKPITEFIDALSKLAPCWLHKLNAALDLKLSDRQLTSELIKRAFLSYRPVDTISYRDAVLDIKREGDIDAGPRL